MTKDIFHIYAVKGNSMFPFLHPGDYVISSIVPYFFRHVRVGDVVVLDDPRDGREIVKRVARLRDGLVYLVGDNLSESTDSRVFGEVSVSRLRGKVIASIRH